MLQNELDTLVKATEDFILGKSLGLTDEEYDILFKKAESEGINPYELVNICDDTPVPHDNIAIVGKSQVRGDFRTEVAKYIERNKIWTGSYYMMPKYDGGSVVIYYKNGYLEKIVSKSLGDSGFIKTEKFKEFVPKRVDPSIHNIQCECLVEIKDDITSAAQGRGKANGVLNSKHDQDQVDKYATLRAFRINYVDRKYYGTRMYHELINLPEIKSDTGRILFAPSDMFDIEDCPTNDVWKFTSGNFVVDGVVICTHTTSFALKFYYTESEITRVNRLMYQYTPKGGFAAVLGLDPVVLNGANISRCSTGGIPNMIAMKMGVGAKVRVIRANMTIPKIIEVIEPSEDYQLPACKSCGTQFKVPESLFSSTLKCHNPECNDKMTLRIRFLTQHMTKHSVTSVEEFWKMIESNFVYLFGYSMVIDRFDPKKRYKCVDLTKEFLEVKESMETDDFERFNQFTLDHFGYTAIERKIRDVSVLSVFKAYKAIINNFKQSTL